MRRAFARWLVYFGIHVELAEDVRLPRVPPADPSIGVAVGRTAVPAALAS